MIRTLALLSLVLVGLVATTSSASAQAPVPATPETAAAFIGDWTLSAQGDQGPAQFQLSLKTEAGKVVASVSMGQGGLPITDIALNGKALLLSFNVDYQGSPIPTVATLTPTGDKFAVTISFAGGAYTMSGTAEKKK